jgi:hypothetical protein
MSAPEQGPADTDAAFAGWMRANLDRAAVHFGLQVTGEPVFGWGLRSIGARAHGPAGDCWLRVVSECPEWAHGDTWTGNADANTLTDLPKPRLLEVTEWDEGDWRRQRAEVLTLLPGAAVSPTDVLRQPVDLSGVWWDQLRAGLDTLHRVPTTRVSIGQATISDRTRTHLGIEIRVQTWETGHGDLHWANVFASPLGLLDWELWGRQPAGADAASLLLFALPVPEVAARVRAVFSDQLRGADGTAAQLVVAARLLRRMDRGDFPELVGPLHDYLDQLRAGVGLVC